MVAYYSLPLRVFRISMVLLLVPALRMPSFFLSRPLSHDYCSKLRYLGKATSRLPPPTKQLA
jgi:hypothetical protein